MAKGSSKKQFITDALALVVGGVVASKASSLPLSFIPDKVKPLVPIVAGYFLSRNKNRMVQGVGAGMIAVGGIKAVSVFAPGLGISSIDEMINGGEDIYLNGMGSVWNALAGGEQMSAVPGGGNALAGEPDPEGNGMYS